MKFWRKVKFCAVVWACPWVLGYASLLAQRSRQEETTTELENFVIYAQPEVFDALRNRPFSKKDPVVEAFFQALPSITQRVFEENFASMKAYLYRCEQEKEAKLLKLSQLAGLKEVPKDLTAGYEERINTLKTILTWMEKELPIQIERLDIWQEAELRWRLARIPVPDIRINPDSGELETRLKKNWQVISRHRAKSKDLFLEFDLGIDLRKRTGYYNPNGFMHWNQLSRKDLKALTISYPVIITQRLRDHLEAELPMHLSAYEETLNSFYNILNEYFFSDLADIHALYILTRGRIFSDQWNQYQATPLLRGLAAQLVFKTLEGQKSRAELERLKQNDWTTWHLRKVGSEYNPLVWEGETAPYIQYGAYKESPNLVNIYWSTRLVQSLMDQYGDSLIGNMCRYLAENNQGRPVPDEVLFKHVTGADYNQVIREFLNQSAGY
ncbi:MAG: hypothetical protein KJT03_16780 [Verrucomicrobiae bacterium]|nr:hypothetical protein [Verrucomicrobiae bacterium]